MFIFAILTLYGEKYEKVIEFDCYISYLSDILWMRQKANDCNFPKCDYGRK